MKKIFFIGVGIGILAIVIWSQFISYDNKGIWRFNVLNQPSEEVVVGICWPFAVNQDGMKNGLQLALDDINTNKLAGAYKLRLVIRDDGFDPEKQTNIAKEFANTLNMSAVIG